MRATVHTYRSGETGLFVNSYVVEGEEGVVAIDAPLLVSDGGPSAPAGSSARRFSHACYVCDPDCRERPSSAGRQ